jgi:hypothetical protein
MGPTIEQWKREQAKRQQNSHSDATGAENGEIREGSAKRIATDAQAR